MKNKISLLDSLFGKDNYKRLRKIDNGFSVETSGFIYNPFTKANIWKYEGKNNTDFQTIVITRNTKKAKRIIAIRGDIDQIYFTDGQSVNKSERIARIDGIAYIKYRRNNKDRPIDKPIFTSHEKVEKNIVEKGNEFLMLHWQKILIGFFTIGFIYWLVKSKR